MPTLTDRRLRDPEYNLEIGTDAPNIRLILAEIEKGQEVAQRYGERNLAAFQTWHARWPGQKADGRKHGSDEEEAFPWEGASDTRIRTVDEQIRDHVTLTEFANDMAKVQAVSNRSFAQGRARQSNQGTKVLQWQVGTQIRPDVERELPLHWTWLHAYGASLVGVDWWQCRRLEYHDLTVPILADILVAQSQAAAMPGQGGAMSSLEALMQVQSAMADPAQFERMVRFIQSLSEIVTTGEARRIVERLQGGYAQIKLAPIFKNQPRLTALRPGVDALWLDTTGDLQQEPWFVWRERISETDAYDRIETDNYDPRFVEQVIQRKGEGSDDHWLLQTLADRTLYGSGYAPHEGWVNAQAANTVDLFHFFYKARVKGTPALYRTVFNPAVTGRNLKNPLVAWHGLHPYAHGLYPAVTDRFEQGDRPILSSRGIAEFAADWQREEKVQADGLADRTALVHRPPLVGPITRKNAVTGSPMPGSYLGVTRPNEFSWMPLPPPDATPLQVMIAVAKRVQRFFGIFGEEVDPELKSMRRKQLAKKRMNFTQSVYEMMFMLDQQYLQDSEVAEIVGELQTAFQVSPKEIREQHTIVVKFDPASIEEDYIEKRVTILDAAAKYNQGGNLNANKAQRILLEMADPDLADEVLENDQAATEREVQDEIQAVNAAMNGLEMPLPLHANHQLRLKTLLENTVHSQNPAMMPRLQAKADTMQILQKREEFYMNNIQQYQENPQIGRTLGGSAFSSKAPRMALPAS